MSGHAMVPRNAFDAFIANGHIRHRALWVENAFTISRLMIGNTFTPTGTDAGWCNALVGIYFCANFIKALRSVKREHSTVGETAPQVTPTTGSLFDPSWQRTSQCRM